MICFDDSNTCDRCGAVQMAIETQQNALRAEAFAAAQAKNTAELREIQAANTTAGTTVAPSNPPPTAGDAPGGNPWQSV